MDQVHKRLTTWQVKVMFKEYYQGLLDTPSIEEILGIDRSRFFALLNKYLHDPNGFCITYEKGRTGLDSQLALVLRLSKNGYWRRI